MASKFDKALAAAQASLGGSQALEDSIPKVKSAGALAKSGDDRYLAEITQLLAELIKIYFAPVGQVQPG